MTYYCDTCGCMVDKDGDWVLSPMCRDEEHKVIYALSQLEKK